MSGSRTKTGCYSCRIRRKKCDEARPQCLACSSRGIDCLGYDVKPAWMTGMGRWQDILESDEAKAIRKSAGSAYNLRRARQRHVTEKSSQDTLNIWPSRESIELRNHHLHNPARTLEGRGMIGTVPQSMVRSFENQCSDFVGFPMTYLLRASLRCNRFGRRRGRWIGFGGTAACPPRTVLLRLTFAM